jgi:hypothetical protein
LHPEICSNPENPPKKTIKEISPHRFPKAIHKSGFTPIVSIFRCGFDNLF